VLEFAFHNKGGIISHEKEDKHSKHYFHRFFPSLRKQKQENQKTYGDFFVKGK